MVLAALHYCCLANSYIHIAIALAKIQDHPFFISHLLNFFHLYDEEINPRILHFLFNLQINDLVSTHDLIFILSKYISKDTARYCYYWFGETILDIQKNSFDAISKVDQSELTKIFYHIFRSPYQETKIILCQNSSMKTGHVLMAMEMILFLMQSGTIKFKI